MKEKTEVQEKGFVFYYSWERVVQILSDADAGALFKALFQVRNGDMLETLPQSAQVAYLVMSDQILRDIEKYQKSCQKKREAVQRRWEKEKRKKHTADASPTDAEPNDTEQYSSIKDYTKENANVNVNTSSNANTNANESSSSKERPRKEPNQNRSQSKPTREEVIQYVQKIEGHTDPSHFFDYFESNGWVDKAGKPIQDWKAMYAHWNETDSSASTSRAAPIRAKQPQSYPPSDNAAAYQSFIYNL